MKPRRPPSLRKQTGAVSRQEASTVSALAPSKTSVTIFYGAESKPFDYSPHEEVRALLARSIAAFHITSNQHLMSLFTEAGVELPDNVSVETAGIKPGETLILRQSAVKGG
jgi:hypothetical protein